MKRRRFIKNTLNLGLVVLPGLEILDQTRSQVKPETKLIKPGGPALKSLSGLVERGDIKRDLPPSAMKNPWVPLYQGNGRFGACFGPWGLHISPDNKPSYDLHGLTRFTHIRHWVRGKFNADYLIPVGSIYWENEPKEITDYEQYQTFYDGTVTTRFTTIDYSVTIISWFDPEQRDIAGFQIDVKGKCPGIIVSTPRLISSWYDQKLVAAVEEKLDKDLWQANIKCLNVGTTLKVKSDAILKQVQEGLMIDLKSGRNYIMVSVNSDINISANQSIHQTKTWWHKTWKDSAWLDLPDETAQEVWVRSLAYTLYSENDDGFGYSPPTGLAGDGWPFPFPFDSSCRHSLLLMTGHTNIARKWIEFLHSRFEGLRDYTKRIFKSEGIFMPHVLPYGEAWNYHFPDVPNKNYYPIYNSAIMVRMADQTAVMVNDPNWTKTYTEPLILEAARFYFSNLRKQDDGLWHLHVVPSISLDEDGDINQPDYFSGLISAQYVLQKAIEYGLDSDHQMQSVLRDGLALKPLLAENGMYHNHLGLNVNDFGRQKHPDQLFPLVHTPLGTPLGEPDKKAHELRYSITNGANTPAFSGHTLGEFILSSARIQIADAWIKDWSMLQPAKYSDPGFMQIYESSGNKVVYYITTHGLFGQAILETLVSTWWYKLDLGSCNVWKDTVRFGNIRTLLGVTVSGEIKNGIGQAILCAWKDTTFKYHDQTITLKKGQKMTVKIQQGDKNI
jgi:hypothetical protein